jgi:hypothetical protein
MVFFLLFLTIVKIASNHSKNGLSYSTLLALPKLHLTTGSTIWGMCLGLGLQIEVVLSGLKQGRQIKAIQSCHG